MDAINNITQNDIIIMIAAFVVGLVFVYFIMRLIKKPIKEGDVLFNEAKNVLKYIPTQADVSIILHYEKEGSWVRSKIEYVMMFKRKVDVEFDLSKLEITKNDKNKEINISNIPEPQIKLHHDDIPETYEDFEIKKGKILGFGKKLDMSLKDEVQTAGERILRKAVEQSALKNIAKKHFVEKINLLKESASHIGWKVNDEMIKEINN